MPKKPPPQPDLFAYTAPRHSTGPVVPLAAPAPDLRALLAALPSLADRDIDLLADAVRAEREKRGLTPVAKPPKRPAAEDALAGLTSGQVTVMKAALAAGVTPAALARQFGIPLARIRKAIKALT